MHDDPIAALGAASPQDGPVLLCSSPQAARDRYEATEVKNLLLRLAGLS